MMDIERFRYYLFIVTIIIIIIVTILGIRFNQKKELRLRLEIYEKKSIYFSKLGAMMEQMIAASEDQIEDDFGVYNRPDFADYYLRTVSDDAKFFETQVSEGTLKAIDDFILLQTKEAAQACSLAMKTELLKEKKDLLTLF